MLLRVDALSKENTCPSSERKQPDLEYTKVRADLDQLKMLKLNMGGRDYLVRTELKGEAHELFRAVGSCPPHRIKELDPNTATHA